MEPNGESGVPSVPLGRGERIPQLGFGVFKVAPGETELAVARALEAGYRHIDTAAMYGNEAEVLQGVRAANLEREQVFITTKCPNESHGYDEAWRALEGSLARLQVEHVDLYLIHWPVPLRDLYVDTWRAFIDMQAQGLTRSIGVSNFQAEHLERVIAETGVTPAINQVELHPYFQQRGLRREHQRLGIVTEDWSPLARGRSLLVDPAILRIAEKHSKTAAQVVIRWHLQLGNVAIPKSVTPERIRENFDVFGFALDQSEMTAIEELDAGDRIGPDPDRFS